MKSVNPLERAALRRIGENYPDLKKILVETFQSCDITNRENTGSGFFSYLVPNKLLPPIPLRSPLGDAWIGVEGLRYGICCLVFLTEGYPTVLEGYSVAGEDTSRIDFGTVGFRISAEPPTDG